MIAKQERRTKWLPFVATVLAIGLGGCGMTTGTQAPQQAAGKDGPPPQVEDCGIVGIGSPSKYACNGKVYTSFALAKLHASDK